MVRSHKFEFSDHSTHHHGSMSKVDDGKDVQLYLPTQECVVECLHCGMMSVPVSLYCGLMSVPVTLNTHFRSLSLKFNQYSLKNVSTPLCLSVCTATRCLSIEDRRHRACSGHYHSTHSYSITLTLTHAYIDILKFHRGTCISPRPIC